MRLTRLSPAASKRDLARSFSSENESAAPLRDDLTLVVAKFAGEPAGS